MLADKFLSIQLTEIPELVTPRAEPRATGKAAVSAWMPSKNWIEKAILLPTCPIDKFVCQKAGFFIPGIKPNFSKICQVKKALCCWLAQVESWLAQVKSSGSSGCIAHVDRELVKKENIAYCTKLCEMCTRSRSQE